MAQSDILSAALDYDASYKTFRSGLSLISSYPLGNNVAFDQFVQDSDAAKDQIGPGIMANIETLETLANEDRNIKIQNGCNPTALQIYSNIQDKVALNPQFTCAQDGYTAPLDVTMCELYRVYEPSQRAFWAIINRPAAN